MLTVGTWLVFAIASVTERTRTRRRQSSSCSGGSRSCSSRCPAAAARAYCRRQPAYLQNTLIVGAGEVGQLVASKFLHHPEFGINVAGFVDSTPKEPRDDIAHIPILGPVEDLPDLVRELEIERVIIAFSGDSPTRRRCT